MTGMGVVATAGQGKDAFWEGLLADPADGPREIADWDPTPWFGPKEVRRSDRYTQFAVAAADMALLDAGPLGADLDRSGVLLATGVGGLHTLEEQIVLRHEKGARRVSPFLVPMMMANAAGAAISMRWGWRGPCEATVTACAASTHAIGNAARLIASGVCDAVLTGGSEAAITPTGMAGFSNMTALSTSGVSRPFDTGRDGFVIAEGAGVLILENLEAALARGAHVYGEVVGAASTADAYHITAPDPQGLGATRALKAAMFDGRIQAEDVVHVNAHATSTPVGDKPEYVALKTALGQQVESVAVSATKSQMGHLLGASGAVEAVLTVLAVYERKAPVTINLENQDPEIPFDVVTKARDLPSGSIVALSNSFGFGGHNAVIAVRSV